MIYWASFEISSYSKSLLFNNLVCYLIAIVLYLKILKRPIKSASSYPYFSSLEYLALIFMLRTTAKCLAPIKYFPYHLLPLIISEDRIFSTLSTLIRSKSSMFPKIFTIYLFFLLRVMVVFTNSTPFSINSRICSPSFKKY